MRMLEPTTRRIIKKAFARHEEQALPTFDIAMNYLATMTMEDTFQDLLEVALD